MPKINPELYGADPTDYAQMISGRILGNPSPTLDINGEKDGRAITTGNHETQGGGGSEMGPGNKGFHGGGDPSADGGT